jgi:uncharacterized protein (DUF3084 family)
VDNEGAKATKSVNKEVTKCVKESEQGSLFEKPITNKIEVIATEDTVNESVKDTVKELIESKDSEIQMCKDALAQKDITIATKDATIATKDKEIQTLNEKIQTLESKISKKDGECREVIDVISDFKKRATATRNWTEFNRFIQAISSLQFSVNFT